MKVLHLCSEMTWRGGEQQMLYLMQELRKQNVDQLLLSKMNSEIVHRADAEKFDVQVSTFRGQWDTNTAHYIRKLCDAQHIDVIHAHSSHGHALAVLAHVMYDCKVPVVLSRRVDFPVSKNFLSKWKYNHNSIKKIICVSDCIKHIMETSIKQKDKCVTIYDGIDLNRFDPIEKRNILHKEFSIADDELLIGNVAAIAPHKDYFTWLQTVALLKGKMKAKFFIIGDGPIRDEIKNEIIKLNLQDVVIMTGFRNDLEKILPELDLFLFTSKEEGLGSSLLDAMLCGVPVVCTNAGGIPEVVKHEVNGLLCNIGDANQLAQNVLRIVNDAQLKMKLIEGGKITAQNFSKQKMASETLAIYNEVLQKV